MMNNEEFRAEGHRLIDWMADYLKGVGGYPVKPDVRPGDIRKKLPITAPEGPEDFPAIFRDFEQVILPGITHWQHPRFMAYFPASTSEPSILGEMLTATIGAQCMVWLTSPAAEELEQRMMEWLRDAMDIPDSFTGVIQDSSSSATLVSLLTAREKRSNFTVNQAGFSGAEKYRVYTSSQAHSSVDKAMRIAGLGIDNLVKVAVDADFAMLPAELEAAIISDISNGFTPMAVVSTIGTTSSTAIDPVRDIAAIAHRYNLWHHVDASYAGTALLLPECRWMGEGLADVDSWVFNPHKWMFTNFDCSAYFVRDPKALQDTFSIMPEYLKTPEDRMVNNYRDWGIPLGRRFRALKLWFVMRSFGLEGIRQKIRDHNSWAQWLRDQIIANPFTEMMAPVPLNLVCMRFHPKGWPEAELNELNGRIVNHINQSGRLMLTQTKLNNQLIIRIVAGNNQVKVEDIRDAWKFLLQTGLQLSGK